LLPYRQAEPKKQLRGHESRLRFGKRVWNEDATETVNRLPPSDESTNCRKPRAVKVKNSKYEGNFGELK